MRELIAWQEFPTEEAASDAADKIRELAKELQQSAQTEYGEGCLRQLEWLEARGLDADYLPENDGPNEYSVWVEQELPTFDNSRMHYE